MPLLDAKREFMFEENCTIIHSNSEYKTILYAFNDLLFLTCADKALRHTLLNYSSFCRDQGPNSQYPFRFQVVGVSDTIQFVMESADEKSKLLDGISNMIENLVVIRKEKFLTDTDQLVYVNVTGTDNRIQGYTIYVTEIEIGTVTTKVI